jgi:maltooligosyltrehalose trehalohydrolase
MPVAEFPGRRGWGYDGVDLYAPHHAYGGPDGLKRLVDEAHRRGLAMIVDCVYNHLGPDGNYLAEFGPYFTDRYSTPWGQAINFDDAHSTQVRSFFIENTLMWMRDYHFDGVRLDAIHAIFDMSAIHFLEEVKSQVETLEDELDRRLWVIAESDLNDPRVVADRSAGGYGLDAQWSDDFHHALHATLTGERAGYYADFWSIAQLAKALRHTFVYDGVYSRYRKRVHGRRPEGIPAHRFLGYLQNHDQVGNRAIGERSGALMSPELLKVAAALVLTSPFVPMLFMGEEWGALTPFQYFTDHEAELGRLVSDGRKREFAAFGWNESDIPDPQDPATFERSRLDWSELDDPRHADILAWHKALIRLRRDHADLTDPRPNAVRVDHDERERWIVVRRGSITIACNLSPIEVAVPLEEERTQVLLLTAGKEPQVDASGITLPPAGVAIFT